MNTDDLFARYIAAVKASDLPQADALLSEIQRRNDDRRSAAITQLVGSALFLLAVTSIAVIELGAACTIRAFAIGVVGLTLINFIRHKRN